MSTAAASPSLFTSVSALRAEHRELQREYRAEGDSPALRDRIEAFMHQAQGTGAILDSEDDQCVVQRIIDLWVTTLYRAGRQTGDFTLAEFDPARAPELADALEPYIGLASFGEKEHEMFFGRQKMVEHLLDRLKTENFIVIIGPSGSGKSSVVLAGLLPAIRKGQLTGSDQWVVLPRAVPGSDPLTNLARCVRPHDAPAGWPASQAALMRTDPGHLKKLADAHGQGRTCVFVVDQFEELSTLCDDESARKAVEENLVQLAASDRPRHIVIATMRSDFIGSVARQPAMQALMDQGLEPVTPLSASELREAIEKPAERVGLRFEPGVVDSLVHDILGEPAALPLLQFTLLKLWETRERNRVTAESYRKLGGGRLALTRSADKFYDRLIPQDKTMADRILLRIVRPGQGQDVVSSRVRKDSLHSIGNAEQVDRVIGKFIDARLVRVTEGDSPGDTEVEVAHEALVRNWGHLVQLLDNERERMTRGRRLEAKAAEWVRLGRGRVGLLAGNALAEGREWIRSEDAQVIGASHDLLALVAASRQAERSAARREFWVKVILAGLTVLSIVFAVAGRFQRNRAVANQELATAQTANAVINWNKAIAANLEMENANKEIQKQADLLIKKEDALTKLTKQLDEKAHLYDSDHLADASKKTLASDPDLSTLRAVQSSIVMNQVGQPDTTETADALRQAVLANRARLVIAGHGGKVQDAAFSPDGRVVATAGEGKPLKFWNSLTGERVPVAGTPTASTIAFSLHGDWAADGDNGVHVHFADGRGDRILDSEGHRATRLAFSHDGRRLAAAAGSQAYVWDLKTPRRLTLSSNPRPSNVNAAAISYDGELVATASDDGIARVYDASAGNLLRELPVQAGALRDVAFSPDGRLIATAGEDRTAKIWEWLEPSRPEARLQRTLQGHFGAVTSIAFSPDGTKIATASQDRTAKVWARQTGIEEFTISSHKDRIRRVQFSLDGSRLLSAGDDGAVRLWNAERAEDLQTVYMGVIDPAAANTIARAPQPTALVASRDGGTLVSSSSDGWFRVWTVTSEGVALKRVIQRKSARDVVAINAAADTAAAVDGLGKEIRIYDLKSGTVKAIPAQGLKIEALALSPDGRRAISGSLDKQLRLWDLDGGQIIASRELSAAVRAVAFSPDGKRVAAALDDGVAVVLSAALTGEGTLFPPHAGSLNTIAFSPDGRRVVTGGYEKIARVWSLDKPSAPALELLDHTGWITGAIFSPDGRSLATASADGTAKFWPLSGNAASPEPYTIGDGLAPLCCAAFSRDGRRLFTAGSDGALRVYALAPAELLALALGRLSRGFVPADCSGLEDQGLCKGMLPALNAIGEANRLARAGKTDEARTKYGGALGKRLRVSPGDLLREIENETRNGMRHLNIDARLALARGLAVSGDIPLSNHFIAEAINLRGVDGYGAGFDPAALKGIVSRQLYKELATMMVRTQDDDRNALKYFIRYLDLFSAKVPDVPLRARQLMYANLLYSARNESNLKQFEKASIFYARARKFSEKPDAFAETDPAWLNLFCWNGSLHGLHSHPDVREACELAVKLTSSANTGILDSRGLNRALNGNLSGAILDFQRYVDDPAQAYGSTMRLEWIATLKTGRSPFVKEVIDQLIEDVGFPLPLSPPVY